MIETASSTVLDDPVPDTPLVLAGRRILFAQPSANRDGSTISGLLVVRGLLAAGAEVDAVFSHDGPAIGDYADAGCDTHRVDFNGWLRRRNPLRFARRYLEQRARATAFRHQLDRRPDLVYVNSLVGLAGAEAARRASIPCVWHVRELFDDVGGEMTWPRLGRAFVRRAITTRATVLVAISRAVAENVLGPASHRAVVVPNAVSGSNFDRDDGRSDCRRQLGLTLQRRIVGVPGHLRPVKGHRFFLDAAERVAQADPNVEFGITGDGHAEYVTELRARVERSSVLAERVRFLGPVDDMVAFYRACDVVCVPSEAEPFGRTVIEAFAAGTPVVATSVGGIRETISDGVSGLLVPFGDVTALADRLGRLLQGEEWRASLAKTALVRARTSYHEDAYRARIVEIVAGAMTQTRQPSGGGA